jgi:hypothetical protein
MKVHSGLLQRLNSEIALGREYHLSEIAAISRMRNDPQAMYLDLDGEIEARRRILFMIDHNLTPVYLQLRMGLPGVRPKFDDESEVHFRLVFEND